MSCCIVHVIVADLTLFLACESAVCGAAFARFHLSLNLGQSQIALRILFLEKRECTSADTPSITCTTENIERYTTSFAQVAPLTSPLTLPQLGLEPLGVYRDGQCTANPTRITHEHFNAISSFHYAYSSLGYEITKSPTDLSPCTDTIARPLSNSPNGTQLIWKCSAVTHVALDYLDDSLPLKSLTQTHPSITCNGL